MMKPLPPQETEQSAAALSWVISQLRWDNLRGAEITAPPPPLTWSEVCTAAQQHQLSNFILARLDASQWNALPVRARMQLKLAYLETLVDNANQLRALTAFLTLCDAERIPVVLLKGAALSAQVYQRFDVRPMCDVDVLVRVADYARVRRLLEADGFVSARTARSTIERDNPPSDDMFKRSERAAHLDLRAWQSVRVPFVYKLDEPVSLGPSTVRLDLHWHVVAFAYDAPRVPIDWFWAHAHEIQLDAARTCVHVFDSAAQLLHLCIHYTRAHRADRLLWLYDIASLIQRNQATLDWPLVMQSARRFDCEWSLRGALAGAHGTFGAPLPPSVLQHISDVAPSVHDVLGTLLDRSDSQLVLDILHAGQQPSFKQTLAYAWHYLFPSHAYMHAHFPAANRLQLGRQYLARLARAAYRYAPRLARAFLQPKMLRLLLRSRKPDSTLKRLKHGST
jgi:Uncharacterised nucleotidyltransferase